MSIAAIADFGTVRVFSGMVNQTQALVLSFLLVAWLGLGAILAVAPEIYDQSLRLLAGGGPLPGRDRRLHYSTRDRGVLRLALNVLAGSWWPSWLACPLPLPAASVAYQLALSYPHRSRRARPRRGSCSSPRSQSTRSMRTAIATSRKRITIERDRSTAVAPGGLSRPKWCGCPKCPRSALQY